MDFLVYSKELGFDETPDYPLIIKQFKDLYEKLGHKHD